jgi:hypothetical protein
LDDTDDIAIINGDFFVDESTLQEVGIILRLNSGELKSDPVLAPNLIQLVKAEANDQEFEERVRLFLKRDNKNYDDIKKLINIKNHYYPKV